MALISSNPAAILAENVHQSSWTGVSAQSPSRERGMNRDSQIRFTAGLLALFTVAAITLAWINFRKESQSVTPYDGVWWTERGGSIVAERVDANGPAVRSGIKPGDRLTAAHGHAV